MADDIDYSYRLSELQNSLLKLAAPNMLQSFDLNWS